MRGASLPLADAGSDEVGESGTAFGRDEALVRFER